MSNHPEEFTPTVILDMRPGGSTPLGGKPAPEPQNVAGAGRGPEVPDHSSTPTVIHVPSNADMKTQQVGTPPPESFVKPQEQNSPTVYHATKGDPVTGWLVVVGGKGYGNALPIGSKQSKIGRGPTQRIRFDFGDEEISREEHCYVIYEKRRRNFTILRGTGAGITYVNNELLVGPRELSAGDIIQMGQTFVRFVPLCGPDFSWEQPQLTEENAFPLESPATE